MSPGGLLSAPTGFSVGPVDGAPEAPGGVEGPRVAAGVRLHAAIPRSTSAPATILNRCFTHTILSSIRRTCASERLRPPSPIDHERKMRTAGSRPERDRREQGWRGETLTVPALLRIRYSTPSNSCWSWAAGGACPPPRRFESPGPSVPGFALVGSDS